MRKGVNNMKKSRRINKRKRHTKCCVRYRSKTRKNKHKIAVMKGGLRAEDCRNIGLTCAYRFDSLNHIAYAELLRRYMFGTKLQEDAWMILLRLCSDKSIPVYILTSGNKVGIIRMLQLALLDRYITEVLCIHKPASVNPINTSGTHNFHEQDKYEVILAIVRELRLPEHTGTPIGYFLDDDEGNFEHMSMCPSIKPECVLSEEFPSDYDESKVKQNDIYKLLVTKENWADIYSDINFTPISIIQKIFDQVNLGAVKILFLDFDKTLQIFNSAIAFNTADVFKHFTTSMDSKKIFPINDSARLT